MCPDWASRQLEISPWTLMSVKFLARRSRIFPVSSLTVQVLRSGMRLKVSWLMFGDSRLVDALPGKSLRRNRWPGRKSATTGLGRRRAGGLDGHVGRQGIVGRLL